MCINKSHCQTLLSVCIGNRMIAWLWVVSVLTLWYIFVSENPWVIGTPATSRHHNITYQQALMIGNVVMAHLIDMDFCVCSTFHNLACSHAMHISFEYVLQSDHGIFIEPRCHANSHEVPLLVFVLHSSMYLLRCVSTCVWLCFRTPERCSNKYILVLGWDDSVEILVLDKQSSHVHTQMVLTHACNLR